VKTAVTGATGLLGLNLVRELLDRQPGLTLLTRARPASTLARVGRFLTTTGAPPRLVEELPDRLRVIRTDVTHPRLGLTEGEFDDLAGELDTVWHCAANIKLDDDLQTLRAVNVEGTRRVLDLVSAGRQITYYHVSTAFVAGGRRTGVVYEDELDDSHGFENNYENSKYEGEILVRSWAAARGRPITVFRPSILVSNLPPNPGLPRHTLGMLTDSLRVFGPPTTSGGQNATEPSPDEIITVRVVGDPRAHLNFMPVDEAARDMALIADRTVPEDVDTYHIVQPHDVPVTLLIHILESHSTVRLRFVPEPPADKTDAERFIDLSPGFIRYMNHRRRYDTTRARSVLGDSLPRTPVDLDYLLAGIGIDGPDAPPATPPEAIPGMPAGVSPAVAGPPLRAGMSPSLSSKIA